MFDEALADSLLTHWGLRDGESPRSNLAPIVGGGARFRVPDGVMEEVTKAVDCLRKSQRETLLLEYRDGVGWSGGQKARHLGVSAGAYSQRKKTAIRAFAKVFNH